MSKINSNYTGRIARTIEQAFGPYTSKDFDDDIGPTWQEWALVIVSALFTLAVVVGTLVWFFLG